MLALTRLPFFLCVLFVGLFSARESLAQAQGGTAAVFHTIQTDPRTRALGDATVALRGAAGAADVNPAAIGQDGSVRFWTNVDFSPKGGGLGAYLRTPWALRVPVSDGYWDDFWLAGPGFDVRHGRLALAYRYKQMARGRWEGRDAQNRPLDAYTPVDRSHKVTFAYDVGPGLTVGAGANLIRVEEAPAQTVGSQQAREAGTLSFDLGLLYTRAFEWPGIWLDASAGWALRDFGRHMRDDYLAVDVPLSTTMQAGVSLQLRSKTMLLRQPFVSVGGHFNLSKQMWRYEARDDGRHVADAPVEALFTTWKPIRVRTNALNEANATYDEYGVLDQLIRQVGVEVAIAKVLYLRSGYYWMHDVVGGLQYASSGMGLDLYYVAVDYSAVTSEGSVLFDNTFWRITARVPFGPADDNIWKALLK